MTEVIVEQPLACQGPLKMGCYIYVVLGWPKTGEALRAGDGAGIADVGDVGAEPSVTEVLRSGCREVGGDTGVSEGSENIVMVRKSRNIKRNSIITLQCFCFVCLGHKSAQSCQRCCLSLPS